MGEFTAKRSARAAPALSPSVGTSPDALQRPALALGWPWKASEQRERTEDLGLGLEKSRFAGGGPQKAQFRLGFECQRQRVADRCMLIESGQGVTFRRSAVSTAAASKASWEVWRGSNGKWRWQSRRPARASPGDRPVVPIFIAVLGATGGEERLKSPDCPTA